MALLSILAIVLPLSGAAGVFLLSVVPRLRPHICYIALAASAITAALLLAAPPEAVSAQADTWREAPEEGDFNRLNSYDLGMTPGP